MLRQAAFLAELADKAIRQMSESLSFSPDDARKSALALANAARALESAQRQVAFWKRVPGPGVDKPAPAKPKRRGNSALPPRERESIAPPVERVSADATSNATPEIPK